MAGDTEILEGALALLGLWVAYHCVWQPALLTMFRQRLFRVRDELFLEAARGRLSFDDTAYGMLRVMTNSTIRASKNVSILPLLLASWLGPRVEPGDERLDVKFLHVLDSMEDRQRAALYREYYERLVLVCSKHLVRMYFPPIISVLVIEIAIRVPLSLVHRSLMQEYKRFANSATRLINTSVLVTEEQVPGALLAA
jgi:hypothetical protein